MRHIISRCEHCGKEYFYQASGDGCFDSLNDRHYCPECKQAIIDALSKIPVQFKPKLNECERPSDDIINIMRSHVEKEKKYDEDYKQQYGFICPRLRKVKYFDDWVKSAAEFIDKEILYQVESPSDDLFDENAKWFRREEYDIINKKFTGKIWLSDKEHYNYAQLNVLHFKKIDKIERPMEMSEPLGKLIYMDIQNIK